jgi:hypothetical protein
MKTLNALILFFATVLCMTSALAQSTTTSATDCQVYVSADDSFELFINGKLVWKDSQYDKVIQKPLPLQRGDVVTITVTDQQGGLGGHLAAVILRSDTVLASSKDFRYTVDPATDFKTNPSLQNLRSPALEPLPLSFGLGAKKQPKKAWIQKSDRNAGMVYFKFVVP